MKSEHLYWLEKITHLNPSRKNGISPHKPLLLLVVADLIEENLLPSPSFYLSADLNFRFLSFASIAAERLTQKPDITLPLYHLHNDEFWIPLDTQGRVAPVRALTEGVTIDDDFFSCLHDSSFRNEMRRILIAKYFVDPSERAALYDLVGLPVPSEDEIKLDAKKYEAAKKRGRDARFKVTVTSAYKHTCALYRINVTTLDSEFIVEAAHIHEHARSRNDEPQNGIALCRNAHWLFDRGLWSVDKNYQVLVATHRFTEIGNISFFLSPLAGQTILLPANRNLWPSQTHLEWHRKNVFGKSRNA